MATTIPFYVTTNFVAAANGAGNLSFAVPQTWVVRVKKWWFTSTGAFRINQIQDSTGVNYTNATQNVPILSTFLQNPGNAFLSVRDLEVPLVLLGGMILNIQVQDTSGAGNTINSVWSCEVDYGV